MRRRHHVPAISLAVVGPEGVRLAAGFGTADLHSGAAATPATQFLWFSMSKIVTATAAMTLVDAGRLDLDTPAAEYVDCLRAPGTAQPTTRQLLNHTSGLANPLPIRWAHQAGGDAPAPTDLLRRQMQRRRVHRHPVGQAARYSNLGYLAAGEVISAAAGEPFERYVIEHVLRPAGISGTGFVYRTDDPVATGYVRAPRAATPALRALLPSGVVGRREGRYLALNRFYVDGPSYGGLVGDVVDAARFAQLHLGDGTIDGRGVLSAEASRAMRVLDQAGKPFDHGLGWFRRPTTGDGDWVEHFGAGVGFWNLMRLYPARGLGVVMMSNSTTSYDFEPVCQLITDEYC